MATTSTAPLRERAARYFGATNSRSMTGVPLGRERYAFVSPTRIWIYEEFPTHSTVINLTTKMRGDLLDALEADYY